MEKCILTKLVGIDEPVVGHGHVRCKTEHRLVQIGIPIIERAVNSFGVELVLRGRRCLNVQRREAVAVRRDEIDNAPERGSSAA